MKNEIEFYANLLTDIKTRVRQGQIKANLSANAEMLATYWDIGKMIHERQNTEGWGKGVIPRLSMDLKNELPEEKGFSERNLRSMVRFYLEYTAIWQLPVAELEKSAIIDISNLESHNEAHNNMLIGLTGWAHHLILMEKIKDLSTRYWYMQECLKNGFETIHKI